MVRAASAATSRESERRAARAWLQSVIDGRGPALTPASCPIDATAVDFVETSDQRFLAPAAGADAPATDAANDGLDVAPTARARELFSAAGARS